MGIVIPGEYLPLFCPIRNHKGFGLFVLKSVREGIMIKTVSKGGHKNHRPWHRMFIIKDNGHTRYLSCTSCKTRRVMQRGGGYQPINWAWLNFHTDKI